MEGRSYYLALQCTEDGARLHLGFFMSRQDAEAAAYAFHRRSEPDWVPIWHEEQPPEGDPWEWAETAYADERWLVIPLQVGANIAEW